MIVAIDGPAGSGKSTVSRELAKVRGLTYLDTGAMYRSVTVACFKHGVSVDDEEAVTELAKKIGIRFEGTGEEQRVLLDGEDVTVDIRTPEVDRNVSAVSSYRGVRETMVEQQRALGAAGDVVAEGRDIGTVVFPDAEVKVFLTADARARAHRRCVQRAGSDLAKDPDAICPSDLEEQILADIIRRDEFDSTREVTPLRPADDATHIDSSNMSVEEVVEAICVLMDMAAARKA
ncbi:MAG: (d)CMP kinase [Atopobiaceae bacterium]|nr:(d)CMP kinase [Atopobiaceae bacterium]